MAHAATPVLRGPDLDWESIERLCALVPETFKVVRAPGVRLVSQTV